ncbi:MAG TPA: hypothetical protein GXX67_12050 [Petrimonas sp.]|nr:hypothetical protein [Petrimonas sp.]
MFNPFNLFRMFTPVCFTGGGGGGDGAGGSGGFSAAYVQDLRDEAAGWRRKLRATEEDNEKLKTQLTEANKKATDLEDQNRAFLESVCGVLGLDASKIKLEDATETVTTKIKEATSSSNVTVEKAQEALKKAAFMASAVKAGVRKEALEDAYKLADFTNVKVDLESMSVFPVNADGKQLTQDDKPVTGLDSLVESMVKEKNWLLGAGGGSGQVGGGTNPPGAGGGEANPWKAETFNLTNQAKILQENPSLAARLKQEAGVK